ncbi:hypothetical protein C923_03070 [Plasmodium falciparum UGT5.1]|uniref:Uncharacterized protein n=1 Tax=Plasmodium falciparum UGT5.1 TaxID=1237627 RepID=W7JBN5_PLAFA|nr:hypothetical protein C923_03070 [Plasmodium falciparum UGT5.1]
MESDGFINIKNSITNILLHFINIIHINLNTNQQKIKNKKIIQALERILKLSYEFKDKSFNYESFILNYCNMLLVSKLDLSLVDNIKILTIFKHIRKSHREGNQHNVQTQRKQRIDKSLNTCQQKEKKKLNDNKLMYATEHCGKKNEIYDIEDNKYIEQTSLHINQSNISHIRENNLESYDINKHLDNMIKLVCCNLKTCVHNSCGNNICMLIPLIYEFHTYMDCELKNILIVQITCNKHNINENNLINILRVFCKIKYRNDMLDQFFYNQKKFNFYDNYLPSHKQGDKKNLYIFSCPKNFFLFFYYKSKNNLFNYKDMYYIENYVQNNFLEMNIKDFLLLLLIYYKNKVFLLPQLLIKILSICGYIHKDITTDECSYIHKDITTDECNKKKNGCVQMYADDNYYNSHNIYNNVNIKVENTIINNKKKFISIKSYLLFLNILKVLDMKNDFNILLKYVSENIHFFSIDIIHRIAFNYDIKNMNNINNNNHEIFFKEILDYIYTLIDYNPSLYFNQMKSINLCINICTNYFFEKRYITEQKKKNDNEDIIYMYNLNYIYINHIITFNNLLHEYNTTKNNIEDYKSEKEYNNNTKKKTLCLFKKSKKIITNVSDILQKGDLTVDVKSLIRPPLQHMENEKKDIYLLLLTQINEVKNIKVKNKKKMVK